MAGRMSEPLKAWRQMRQVAKETGSWRAVFNKLLQTKDWTQGTLVGVDANGNRYFENTEKPRYRSRWVEYGGPDVTRYDASSVPPEWHAWLHHFSDYAPHAESNKLAAPVTDFEVGAQGFVKGAEPAEKGLNRTGTEKRYVNHGSLYNAVAENASQSYEDAHRRHGAWKPAVQASDKE